MPAPAYALSLLPGLLTLATLWIGGWTPLLVPALLFVLVPAAELVLGPRGGNLDAETEAQRRSSPVPDALLFAVVPMQLAIVGGLVWGAATGHLAGWSLVAATFAVGIGCAAYGINVAHELGHRRERLHRGLSKVLLFSTLYMHFYIEHNRGHHARVATPDDPASARRGEAVYGFWWRSVTGSWRSAWALEDKRLRKRAHPRRTLDNEMVRFTLIQGGALLACLALLGPVATGAWVAAATLGFLLLETVNYVEHYGLQREQRPDGGYERVQPAHSWNANHPLGRVLLFELTRHSDHHAHPARPFVALRHFDDVPQLPTGYPGMVLLALVPPLFQAVMHRQLEGEERRLAQAA